MSVNNGYLIVSGYNVEGENQRLYSVREERNSVDSDNSGITLYANTYTHFTFTQEYKSSKFLFCDVVITNRFTMESTRFTIDFSKTDLYNDDNVVNMSTLHKYTHAKYDSDIDVKYSQLLAENATSSKQNVVRLKLSMADFMYGDICVQFYDDPNNKDQYCAPVIIQFTNAPTVNTVGIYKWRPNFTTKTVEDYDNIFTSSFGSRLTDVADEGRTDVFTTNGSTNTEYYNDFTKSNRLITNGYTDPVKHDGNEVSLSGHPVYMIEYRTFVPSAFSEMFGINHSLSAVSFSAINEEKSYLTSAVDDWQIMQNDKLNLRMYTQNDADGRRSFLNPEFQLSAAKSGTNQVTTIGGVRRVYVAHLTAASGTDRPDDAWFRDHTRVCADFVLTGIDPYWMSDDKV